MRISRQGYDRHHPPDVPPYQRAGETPRIVHEYSDEDFAKMKCGLLRRCVDQGARDIMDGKLPTCLWCVVGRY